MSSKPMIAATIGQHMPAAKKIHHLQMGE